MSSAEGGGGGPQSEEQVIGDGDTTAVGVSKMEGDIGGGGGGAFGGGESAVNLEPINFNGGGFSHQVNYLNGGWGRRGGSWGQGGLQGRQGYHGHFGGIGPVATALPQVQDWNYFYNWLVAGAGGNSYPCWYGGGGCVGGGGGGGCGYQFPNYGWSSNLGGSPSQQGAATGSGRRKKFGGRSHRDRQPTPGGGEIFSRKVFIGGLPPDIDEDEIIDSFADFGPVVVDWPRKSQSKGYFPPKGYAFLLFKKEQSVKQLVDGCVTMEEGQGHGGGDGGGHLFYFLDSPTVKAKRVEIRPWRLADADFKLKEAGDLNLVAFVGGVPRPLRAVELARILDEEFGGVGEAGVEVDKGWRYPKGCGRVGFLKREQYDKAIGQRFVWFRWGNGFKQMEIKPFEEKM